MGDGPAKLVSIDPGAQHFGVAWWDEGWLREARLVPIDEVELYFTGQELGHAKEVAIERMKIYPPGSPGRRGDQGDLIAVAESSGWLVRMLLRSHRDRAHWYLASDWKGGLDKPVCHRHVRAELERASCGEMARVVLPKNKQRQLDVWDAVGIGLAHLGRAPWRVRRPRRVKVT